MKIYTQDHGVYGSILVIANSKDEARLLMEDAYNYDKNEIIEEFPIEAGFVHINLGDC